MTEYISRDEILDFLQVVPIDLGYREIDDVEQFVKQLPAADVAPVRHGYWDSDGHTVACSNCHTLNLHQRAWEYCPYCGTKMDGGDHDAAD